MYSVDAGEGEHISLLLGLLLECGTKEKAGGGILAGDPEVGVHACSSHECCGEILYGVGNSRDDAQFLKFRSTQDHLMVRVPLVGEDVEEECMHLPPLIPARFLEERPLEIGNVLCLLLFLISIPVRGVPDIPTILCHDAVAPWDEQSNVRAGAVCLHRERPDASPVPFEHVACCCAEKSDVADESANGIEEDGEVESPIADVLYQCAWIRGEGISGRRGERFPRIQPFISWWELLPRAALECGTAGEFLTIVIEPHAPAECLHRTIVRREFPIEDADEFRRVVHRIVDCTGKAPW